MSLHLEPADISNWRHRLREERNHHNITPRHQQVIEHVAALVESGHDMPTHEEIAAATDCSVRTVRDALSRGRRLEVIAWEHQYRVDPATGLRRQEANRYRWILPTGPAVPRPDVRRPHRGGAVRSASEVRKNLHPAAYEWSTTTARASLAAIAARREAQIAQQWLARRRFDPG